LGAAPHEQHVQKPGIRRAWNQKGIVSDRGPFNLWLAEEKFLERIMEKVWESEDCPDHSDHPKRRTNRKRYTKTRSLSPILCQLPTDDGGAVGQVELVPKFQLPMNQFKNSIYHAWFVLGSSPNAWWLSNSAPGSQPCSFQRFPLPQLSASAKVPRGQANPFDRGYNVLVFSRRRSK